MIILSRKNDLQEEIVSFEDPEYVHEWKKNGETIEVRRISAVENPAYPVHLMEQVPYDIVDERFAANFDTFIKEMRGRKKVFGLSANRRI